MSLDCSDPYENWQRLLRTHDYLVATDGRPQTPDFYATHTALIRKYIEVLEGTPDCDQSARPYFEHLAEEFDTKGYFDLRIYLFAVSKLIDAKNDTELDDALCALTLR
jgi:hypothetical protein